MHEMLNFWISQKEKLKINNWVNQCNILNSWSATLYVIENKKWIKSVLESKPEFENFGKTSKEQKVW